MDYEIQRCTRRCAKTGREFRPGEAFFSVVVPEGSTLVRRDYAVEAWQGPPEGVLAWWKSQLPSPEAKRVHWAPNQAMLQWFEDLEHQPDAQPTRYLLALLLVRRRVLRVEEETRDANGQPCWVLYCPRRDATYRVLVALPDETRIPTIQEELARLLFRQSA